MERVVLSLYSGDINWPPIIKATVENRFNIKEFAVDKVADKHYRQVWDSHFQKTAQELCISNQKNNVSPLRSIGKHKKNCAYLCAVHAGNGLQINEAANKKAAICSLLQLTTNACEPTDSRGGTRIYFDNSYDNNNLRQSQKSGGAKSGALVENAENEGELVAKHWSKLPDNVKIQILLFMLSQNTNIETDK